MSKKPEHAAIFLLANALTGALTYILTLRSIAKQLSKQKDAEPEVRIIRVPQGEGPPQRKRPAPRPEDDAEETPEEIAAFNKAHPGLYL